MQAASQVFDFDLTVSNGGQESDLEFENPIIITVGYDTIKVTNHKKLGMYYYNEETEQWEYVGGKANADGTFEFDANHFSKYTIMEYDKTFPDVDMPWAKNEIEILAARHIIDGVDGVNYAPNANITRAAFAKLLVYALDLERGDNQVAFTDVQKGAWYQEPVEIAASLGIVTGYEGKFNPNGQITREQMATMLVRALKHVDPDGQYTQTIMPFGDADKVESWASDSVAVAYDKGLITGKPGNVFEPKNNATRAESAVVIYRLLDLLGEI